MPRRAEALSIDPSQLDGPYVPTQGASAESLPRLRNADSSDLPAPSLPVALQQEVARALAEGSFDARGRVAAADDRKWSQRQTLAFILVTCGGFWAIFAWAMTKLF